MTLLGIFLLIFPKCPTLCDTKIGPGSNCTQKKKKKKAIFLIIAKIVNVCLKAQNLGPNFHENFHENKFFLPLLSVTHPLQVTLESKNEQQEKPPMNKKSTAKITHVLTK